MLTVVVLHAAGPGQLDETVLELPEGSTVNDALIASRVFSRHLNMAAATAVVGIWGRRCDRTAVLAAGDRVEIYRPLRVDPKDARRARHRTLVKAANKPRSPASGGRTDR